MDLGERAVPLRPGGKLGDIAPTLLDLCLLLAQVSGESLPKECGDESFQSSCSPCRRRAYISLFIVAPAVGAATLSLIAPTQPSMTCCESWWGVFPVMPVDERTVHYVKTMFRQRPRRLDPDFA